MKTTKCVRADSRVAGLCLAAALWTGASSTAVAQEAPKIENPPAIPSTVQPGAIEATFDDVEIAPDFSGAPAVMSPYEPDAPANAADIRFVLNNVMIDGGGALPGAAIRETYAARLGTEVSLAEIYGFARAITRAYADAGYPLSLAYVPTQEIDDGSVRIRIIEGYIGEVDVSGAPKRAQGHLRRIGKKLMAERPLTQASLERYLLLANQTPGVTITGVLERASEASGGVKMTFKTEKKRFDVAVGINNRASIAVGREQFYGRLSVNGLLTGADQFKFGAVQSVDLDELTFFTGGYSTILTPDGLTLGIAATRSEAAPGIPFLRDLGFETEGWTAGVNLSYPVILKRGTSLALSTTATWKQFQSAFDVSPNTEDILYTTAFSANLAHADRFKGKNALAVSLIRGWDVFDATEAGDPLASRAGAGAEFLAVVADVSRNQTINDWLNAVVAIKAQTANNPLLSSEQCGFGGAGIGRGYDPFQISGDRCIVGLLELQASPDFLKAGDFQARPYVSVDAGAVRQIGPLAAGENRTDSLYSFAVGARMSLTRHVSAGVEGALPLKDIVPGDDRNMRFFFSIEARY